MTDVIQLKLLQAIKLTNSYPRSYDEVNRPVQGRLSQYFLSYRLPYNRQLKKIAGWYPAILNNNK